MKTTINPFKWRKNSRKQHKNSVIKFQGLITEIINYQAENVFHTLNPKKKNELSPPPQFEQKCKK